MSSGKQRLINLFNELDQQAQQSLLDFAEFLQTRPSMESDVTAGLEQANSKQEPLFQDRPKDESVINAIKRLRASYYMIDADGLLNDASALMTQFMLQGRAAEEVIDDLEQLFDRHYQDYLDS